MGNYGEKGESEEERKKRKGKGKRIIHENRKKMEKKKEQI